MTAGRPKKEYVNLHVQLPIETKKRLEEVASMIGISMGEAVAFILKEWWEMKSKDKNTLSKKQLLERKQQVEQDLRKIQMEHDEVSLEIKFCERMLDQGVESIEIK